jgi:DNA-binding response OmpR family regulator
MTAVADKTNVLLLVEDNPGDAQLVAEMLACAEREEGYRILHVSRLAEAVQKLKSISVDVVVLDLRLPDCIGVDSVKTVRDTAGQVPIVVLTGSDDEQLALACIDAGAQDYLAKSETQAQNLRRSIGYAITRRREAQVRELQETLARYRALSSDSQGTTVTASLLHSGAIAARIPNCFHDIVGHYLALLDPYLSRQTDRVEAARPAKEYIITALGDQNGGPRDLLDVHIAALDRALERQDDARSSSLVFEARLLGLEMMGLLVDYYRVGYRRRSAAGVQS